MNGEMNLSESSKNRIESILVEWLSS